MIKEVSTLQLIGFWRCQKQQQKVHFLVRYVLAADWSRLQIWMPRSDWLLKFSVSAFPNWVISTKYARKMFNTLHALWIVFVLFSIMRPQHLSTWKQNRIFSFSFREHFLTETKAEFCHFSTCLFTRHEKKTLSQCPDFQQQHFEMWKVRSNRLRFSVADRIFALQKYDVNFHYNH